MNNLTQEKQDPKQSYLNRQQVEMLITYQNAAADERKAVIRQINSFLSVVPKDAKTIWLKVRYKLERLNNISE